MEAPAYGGPSFDTTWDVEKYRNESEPAQHWWLRRQFMSNYKRTFPEERLVCLSQVFCNVEFLGCKYPAELMDLVEHLSKDLAVDYHVRNVRTAKATLVEASGAAAAKVRKTTTVCAEVKKETADPLGSSSGLCSKKEGGEEEVKPTELCKKESSEEAVVEKSGAPRLCKKKKETDEQRFKRVWCHLSKQSKTFYTHNDYEPFVKDIYTDDVTLDDIKARRGPFGFPFILITVQGEHPRATMTRIRNLWMAKLVDSLGVVPKKGLYRSGVLLKKVGKNKKYVFSDVRTKNRDLSHRAAMVHPIWKLQHMYFTMQFASERVWRKHLNMPSQKVNVVKYALAKLGDVGTDDESGGRSAKTVCCPHNTQSQMKKAIRLFASDRHLHEMRLPLSLDATMRDKLIKYARVKQRLKAKFDEENRVVLRKTVVDTGMWTRIRNIFERRHEHQSSGLVTFHPPGHPTVRYTKIDPQQGIDMAE